MENNKQIMIDFYEYEIDKTLISIFDHLQIAPEQKNTDIQNYIYAKRIFSYFNDTFNYVVDQSANQMFVENNPKNKQQMLSNLFESLYTNNVTEFGGIYLLQAMYEKCNIPSKVVVFKSTKKGQSSKPFIKLDFMKNDVYCDPFLTYGITKQYTKEQTKDYIDHNFIVTNRDLKNIYSVGENYKPNPTDNNGKPSVVQLPKIDTLPKQSQIDSSVVVAQL